MHPLSPKPNLPKNAHYHLNTGGIDEPNGIHQDISPFYLIQWYTTRWPTIWKVESLIELKRVNGFYYRPFQTRLRKDLNIYLWTGCVWSMSLGSNMGCTKAGTSIDGLQPSQPNVEPQPIQWHWSSRGGNVNEHNHKGFEITFTLAFGHPTSILEVAIIEKKYINKKYKTHKRNCRTKRKWGLFGMPN